MSVDAREESFEHIELFGKPVLFTNARIETSSVPDNWYCYDLRGSDRDPGRPAMLEALVVVNHAGSILSPEVIPFTKGKDYRSVKGKLNFLGEEMTLRQFCKHHDLTVPTELLKYKPRPASPDEAGLFYALPAEQDAELGAIGHVRMDFGRRGTEFWHTWHPRGPEELNSPEFKAELQEVVDELRESVLKSYSAMTRYCHGHGGAIKGGLVQNYGYIVETDNYRYCLRCNPVQGDYNAYLSCFDKRVQEMNMAADEDVHQKIRDWYTAKFPADELGPEIKDITFAGLVESMNRGEDVYETLGVEDSIVRERIFDKAAKLLQVDYDVIYYKWLYGKETPDIELPRQEAARQQDMTIGGMSL